MEKLTEFINEARKKYREIGYIECPAFDSEKIYFTNKGYNHLLKKDRKFRDSKEQIRRMRLLPYVVDILRTSTTFITHRTTEKQFKTKKGTINSRAQFWSFGKDIEGKKIIVIVCQINEEPKIFMSVMDKD